MSSPTSIVAKGRDTRVCVEGDVLARPILLLHGLGRCLEDWAPQHHRLAGCRTIALDMPGFGFSARPSGPNALPVLAQAVVDTLDVLGEHRPVHVMANCGCRRR